MVLLVSTYVSGIGCGRDLESAVRWPTRLARTSTLPTIASPRWIVDPTYRGTFRAIASALVSRPTLTGEDVAALLAR